MSSSWPKPGIAHVPEYQVSGNCFVVGNETTARAVTLNFISKAIIVCANADGAEITFTDETSGGAVSRTIKVPKGVHRFPIKCKSFGKNAIDMSIVVELTNIPANQGQLVIPSFAKMGTIV